MPDDREDPGGVKRDALTLLRTRSISATRVLFVDAEGEHDRIGYVSQKGEARTATVLMLPEKFGFTIRITTEAGLLV